LKYEYLFHEKNPGDLFELYQSLEWQQYLNIDAVSLSSAMKNSFRAIYVYEENLLIGTGRVISDGIINAYICGIGVDTAHRNQGIGSEILSRLVNSCEQSRLQIQLLCEEHLTTYYKSKGFEVFAIGMKKDGL